MTEAEKQPKRYSKKGKRFYYGKGYIQGFEDALSLVSGWQYAQTDYGQEVFVFVCPDVDYPDWDDVEIAYREWCEEVKNAAMVKKQAEEISYDY